MTAKILTMTILKENMNTICTKMNSSIFVKKITSQKISLRLIQLSIILT